MLNYSRVKQEAERVKRDFPVVDYFQCLVSSGFLKYEGIQGKEYFFGFLTQRTGSIAVDANANLWYDHSAGRGGDILEAVQVFEGKSFTESIQRLSDSPPERITIQKKKSVSAPNIVVENVKEISHNALVNFIRERGLEPDEINQFAKEVHWRNKGKRYFAVGFPNESEGWVLRSSIFKGNILGGGISIKILGKPEKIKIFEGWFDFLSYLKLSRASDFKAIILNSTANLSLRLMLDILNESEKVDLYLDNDATGEESTINFVRVAQLFCYCHQNGLSTDWDLKALRGSRDKIVKLLANLKIKSSEVNKIWRIQTDVSDQRSYYESFEDVNEFLMRAIQK
ncbi:toprim domain-containing protein [Algoriphagus pacificus]|uniref:Toprim domain-containing protein n=1 Tax=Algoriphagus pacificus TaxID=2811234 RepID=A0ABS3CJK1_9BACT|nr:toprim domain-containing protein [Algoriphagus pacificus]MBN7817282.1 toprim domain-containing protein [Algoriphagus pacificus]